MIRSLEEMNSRKDELLKVKKAEVLSANDLWLDSKHNIWQLENPIESSHFYPIKVDPTVKTI